MNALRKILIVGGGSAGWIAAAMLSRHLKPELCQVELVESEQLGIIGIGESTIPPFVGLIQNLNIQERDFIQSTQASYKLGIEFVDWRTRNSRYFHPFGVIGKRLEHHDFYQCWLRASQAGREWPLQDFAPSSAMAAGGKFFLPSRAQNTPIGGANYALHVDAHELARYLRNYAEARGVVRTQGLVSQVLRSESGAIGGVVLDDDRQLSADFYIDCTGFKSLLLDKGLGIGFEDWSQYLPCDHAIAVKTERSGPLPPYTRARALDSGWCWRIPLQSRTGHGYVYANEFCSHDRARTRLMQQIDGAPVHEAKVIPFKTGRRQVLWHKNCLALGLAAGFIEPLESTAIHLIGRGMEFFLRYFPDRDCDPSLIREYNRRMVGDLEEVRDFIVLHYCTSQRDDSPFWRHCRNLPLPDSLRERMELFKARGLVPEGLDNLFRAASWQSIFEGMGIRPRHYCPRVDNLSLQQIDDNLRQARQAIATMVSTLPSHEEFLLSQGLMQVDLTA